MSKKYSSISSRFKICKCIAIFPNKIFSSKNSQVFESCMFSILEFIWIFITIYLNMGLLNYIDNFMYCFYSYGVRCSCHIKHGTCHLLNYFVHYSYYSILLGSFSYRKFCFDTMFLNKIEKFILY